jgi:DNA-binding GntR family transcriptional regulator
MRVTAITPEEVDAIYAARILLEGLGVALTVPRLTKADQARIKAAFVELHSKADGGYPAEWEPLLHQFHLQMIAYAGPVLSTMIGAYWDRSERFRRGYARVAPMAWLVSKEGHAGIVEAYARGSVELAVDRASRHLARTALALISHIEPSYEPRAIRYALSLTAHPDRLHKNVPVLDLLGADLGAPTGLRRQKGG